MATMAVSFSNFISLLLLSTLFMSLTIHARDSQFFSKVTHVTIPATTNNNVVKETELPRKEVPVNKPEQEPSFIPETESSYGLYGHESYKTEPEQHTDKYPNKYYTYNNDAYNTNQKEFTNTKLTGTEYSNDNNNNNYNYNNNYKTDAYGRSQNEFNSMENHNNNYNQKYEYNNNNNAGNDRYFDNNKNDKYFYDKYASKNTYYTNNNNAANNKYNVERQGMSDTRFMENGKYFYDLESEKHDQSLYGVSSKGVNSRNWENNRGYFGNNNVKSYENNNSFEGYQNQEEFEEEPENFEP